VPEYLDGISANLRRAAADGRVAAREPVERVLDVLDGLERQPVTDWKLAAPAAAEHEGWSERDEAHFREAVMDAVAEDAIPAFRRFRDTLKDAVLPVARPS